jgi:hypothetical protein
MSVVHLQTRHLHSKTVALTQDLQGAIAAAWGTPEGWLIAQTFGGVIWGRAANGHLTLTTTAAAAAAPDRLLQPPTLIALRLFNADRELRAWQCGSDPMACMLSEDSHGEPFAAYTERRYALHLPPALPEQAPAWLPEHAGQNSRGPLGSSPGWLRVRHYLTRDPETGLLRVAEHRLLCVEP